MRSDGENIVYIQIIYVDRETKPFCTSLNILKY